MIPSAEPAPTHPGRTRSPLCAVRLPFRAPAGKGLPALPCGLCFAGRLHYHFAMNLPVRKKLPHTVPQWVAEGSWFFITIKCVPPGKNQPTACRRCPVKVVCVFLHVRRSFANPRPGGQRIARPTIGR